MLRLILLRHAKSSWNHGDSEDWKRPLGARGERDGPVMAKRLAEFGKPPAHVLCSDAARTQATSKFFIEALQLDERQVEYTNDLYLADHGQMLDVVFGAPDVPTLMLIGHNPGITDLHNKLADTESMVPNMPTCAISIIEFDANAWTEIGAKRGRCVAFLTPKDGQAS